MSQANSDFLATHPHWKVIFEAYTQYHPSHMKKADQESVRRGWWNDLNILVRDKDNILLPSLPPTIRDRSRFLWNHVIHGSGIIESAPGAVEFVQYLLAFELRKAAARVIRLCAAREATPGEVPHPRLA